MALVRGLELGTGTGPLLAMRVQTNVPSYLYPPLPDLRDPYSLILMLLWESDFAPR
jgi:hypothetical protein